MSPPPRIRALKPEELKVARYMIGGSLMTPLAEANRKAYKHPLTFASWVALASIMIQLLGWWPRADGPLGIWGVLAPLPAFAATAVPIMFYFDWFNRPTFEEAVQKALTATDMKDPQTHYSRSPASGFYVLEYKDKLIGLIALDASPTSSNGTSKKKAGMAVDTAVIRHFHVDEVYHASDVQSDLLRYAISRAFSASSASRPQRVRAVSSELEGYKAAALRAVGFHSVARTNGDEQQEWKIGVYGWKSQWVEVTGEEWEAKRD